MSSKMPTVCDLVSVWVFMSGSSQPLTYSVLPTHTAAEIGRSIFRSEELLNVLEDPHGLRLGIGVGLHVRVEPATDIQRVADPHCRGNWKVDIQIGGASECPRRSPRSATWYRCGSSCPGRASH